MLTRHILAITLCGALASVSVAFKKARKAEHVPFASRARQVHELLMLLCVFSCVTLPSQVHRRQTSSTSSSRSGRASLVSSVRAIHISRSSVSGQAAEQGVCVQKVARASPDRWRQCVKEDPYWSVGQCLGFLCHPPITRPAACGRSRRTSSSC